MQQRSKNVLVYMGHPAHFHLFRYTIDRLKADGHEVLILIKKKDVLEDLLQNSGHEYLNINPGVRGDGKIAILSSLINREFQVLKAVRRFRPDIMIGTSAEITHVGKLFSIPSLVFNEDDAPVVPYFAKAAYPFATHIVAPECTDVGRWEHKKISYKSYHELAYLHPDHFTPSEKDVEQYVSTGKFYVLRFAKLTAHHDEGRSGISDELARELIAVLSAHGRVILSTERDLPEDLGQYVTRINPLHMHSLLALASMYIGDSQTMAAEAAVLGTPSVRFNDFVGEIAYLDELENRYGLTRGIQTSRPDELLSTVTAYCRDPELKTEQLKRKESMLKERINATDFFTWLVENYPHSIDTSNYISNSYTTPL